MLEVQQDEAKVCCGFAFSSGPTRVGTKCMASSYYQPFHTFQCREHCVCMVHPRDYTVTMVENENVIMKRSETCRKLERHNQTLTEIIQVKQENQCDWHTEHTGHCSLTIRAQSRAMFMPEMMVFDMEPEF